MTGIPEFQSTLSVRRATFFLREIGASTIISIHALRKESDFIAISGATVIGISIHALRKESDAFR